VSSKKSREVPYQQILIYFVVVVFSVLFIGTGYFIGAGYFIGTGYLLEHGYPHVIPLLSHISTEIGIAGFIAIFLAMTIEHLSEQRHERRQAQEKEDIKKDVFEHVLGYRLPEGTFAELDNQILNASFIRKDFAVTYKLSPLPTDPRFIKINGQISYKLVNITPEPKAFEFRTMIEKAPIEELDMLVRFTVVNIRQEGSPRDLLKLVTEKEIHDALEYQTPNHLLIKRQISILGNRHASATIRFEIVRAFHGGSSIIITPLQALGFDLKVEAWEQVEVLAVAYLREDLTEGDQHLPRQNSYHWVLKRPMLPYQGVYLTWKSKAGADPENTVLAVDG
jgi:hypothetical protein